MTSEQKKWLFAGLLGIGGCMICVAYELGRDRGYKEAGYRFILFGATKLGAESMAKWVEAKFPDAVTELCVPFDTNGEWMILISIGEKKAVMQYHPLLGGYLVEPDLPGGIVESPTLIRSEKEIFGRLTTLL